MGKLETLVVPEELGTWLDNRELGDRNCYFTVINELDKYWQIASGPPLSIFIAENKKELIEVILGSREYKVEEPKFYVYLGDGQYLVSEDDLKEPYVKIRHQEDRGFLNYNMTFTEQEIKGYDKRYWLFHEPVEDMMSRLFRESNDFD